MSGGLLVDLLVDVDKHRVKEMVEKLILLCKDVPAIFIVFIEIYCVYYSRYTRQCNHGKVGAPPLVYKFRFIRNTVVFRAFVCNIGWHSTYIVSRIL